MIKLTAWIAFLGVFSYCSICLFLFLRQRSLIFYPHPAVQSDQAEVFWLENEGERLKIYRYPGSSQTALIYFGGNAEDVSLNLGRFKKIFPELSLYLMNYRGYGGSSGHPTENGIYSDSSALYEYIAASHDRIIVMGRSLGTAVAVRLAAEKTVAGVILVTPYSSMTDLANHYYPLLPVRRLLKDRFEAARYAPAIDVPVLAMVAGHDEVIPAHISARLVESLKPGTVRKIIIEEASHNTIDSSPGYEEQLVGFVSGLEQNNNSSQ